jgi:hypothetical protein
VALDVNRIYPEEEFFEAASIRTMLADVLTIWALEHPRSEDSVGGQMSGTDQGKESAPAQSYRQGMHELLAPILFVLESEKRAINANAAGGHRDEAGQAVYRCTDIGIVLTQLDMDHTEHDAYLLFSKMMEVMEAFFDPVEPGHVVCELQASSTVQHDQTVDAFHGGLP